MSVRPIKKHGHITYFLLSTSYTLKLAIVVALSKAIRVENSTYLEINSTLNFSFRYLHMQI